MAHQEARMSFSEAKYPTYGNKLVSNGVEQKLDGASANAKAMMEDAKVKITDGVAKVKSAVGL